MQVKKYEAPTLQEALETIKRELGPEAIILQTKQNRRGFGLMSKSSVEVTAAVSERATSKKNSVDKRLPDAYAQKINDLPASKQADIYESYLEKRLERDKVQLSGKAEAKKKSAVRYADMVDEETDQPTSTSSGGAPNYSYTTKQSDAPLPSIAVPEHLEQSLENYQTAHQTNLAQIEEELKNLKRLVEEMRKERKKPEYLDSDSPYEATEALQEAYELLVQTGVERRFCVQLMREVGRKLNTGDRADKDKVLDAVAEELLKNTDIKPFFQNSGIVAFVGVSGVGKTSLIAKLATHAARVKNEKIGMIRIQLSKEEGADPLVVFAKAIHVPYRMVQTADELTSALQDLSQCSTVFIDTPGASPREPQVIQRLQKILRANALGELKIRIQFVVSSTTRDLELHEQAKAFLTLKPESLMFTKLDEAYSFGVIYSLSKRVQLPVSVFSTGKKVTEGWENASAERLTASILNII